MSRSPSIPLRDRPASKDRDVLLALGQSLAHMREVYGLTREDVVDDAVLSDHGVGGYLTVNKIRKWESGQASMGINDLFLLSAVLGPFWTWPVPEGEVGDVMRNIQEIFA